MCVDTLITYTACNCKIMIKSICFDHIQHTLKQEDRNLCPKKIPGLYTIRTSPNLCFLKSGSKLEDGRIFRHGSHRTRHYYEFERDPDDPKKRWESWELKNRVLTVCDRRHLNLEADNHDDDSHKERESQIREWQEETKNNRPPRVKIEDEEKMVEKEQPAPGRKTVNHVLYDMFDSRSDDEFSDDDDWKPEAKIEVDPGHTVPWSSNNSRSFSDSTRASGTNTNTNTTQEAYTSPTSRDDGGLFSNHSPNAIHDAETHRPATPHSQFNFNPPFSGTHTKYTHSSDKSHSSHGSRSSSTRTNNNNTNTNTNTMDFGSPKHRAQIPAEGPPRRHDVYRPHYPSMSVDAHSSFWAGHLNQASHNTGTNRPPPYFPSPSTLAPHNDVAGGASGPMGVDGGNTASGDGEIRGVYGNYTSGENHERENKKARVDRPGPSNLDFDFDNTSSLFANNERGEMSRDESEKQRVNGIKDAGDDVEMVE
ncbi:hypothetical protein BPOR_0015g00210 [Botrytis porri]|uniref:Uncharacterized protein n=1 Tax=Botrytis porri TaxID=87229 RepID=A0A4Z1L4Y9_9HELO|nr:hypothetical protein BPOR_0015g00210 [Botrytis porri]